MELSVRIESTSSSGFRATSGEPLPATAEGSTKTEALNRLRNVIEEQLRTGTEVVRLQIDLNNLQPIWPDDSITQDWLAAIATARETANRTVADWESK
jgi:hypothetical protein